MPYITEERREQLLDEYMDCVDPKTPGELNYLMTVLALRYLDVHGLSYSTLNDISGAFTEAAAEFRRRVIAPYEDEKILENGDVYPSLVFVIQVP